MKKLLIIEDDPIVAHIYRSRLEKEGYAVQVFADGQSGYYGIHDTQPDAVLLDLMLPKMNGVELLKKIRAQVSFKTLPIVVFTNAYVSTMVGEAIAAGATTVLDKGTLTPRQVADALATALGKKSAAPAAPASPPAPAPTAPAPSPGPAPTPAAVTNAQLKDLLRQKSAPAEVDAAKAFFDHAPEHLQALRKLFQEVSKTQDEAARTTALDNFYRQVHALTSKAGLAGMKPAARVASALEALIKELCEKPKTVTPSTLRTAATALDLLKDLCAPGLNPDLADVPPVGILVVDDDMLARRALTFALQKAFDRPENADCADAALALAAQRSFDVIFLDVQMPGMDGFTLCSKIRATDTNRATPVVFVTSHTDFSSRAQSTLSGGNDLIAKPFLFIEVTVKALTFALRGRLLKGRKSAG
ncbi:MAG: response regulator [Verrucomicrobia bacterium]|nr:response regulator [Verrucomicrobiota bacterium]